MGFNDQGWWRWDEAPEAFTMRYKDKNGQWLSSVYTDEAGTWTPQLAWLDAVAGEPTTTASSQRFERKGGFIDWWSSDIDASKTDGLEADAHYTSMEAMMANEQLHGVAIVTPPETHLSLAQQAFENEAAVLMEKPLSENARGQPTVPLYRRRQGSGGGLHSPPSPRFAEGSFA